MFRILKEPFRKIKKLAEKQPEILRYEELEPRVLFSADVAPGLENVAADEQVLVEDVTSEVEVEREAAPETVEQTAAEVLWELVFVNDNVTEYEQLITDLQGNDHNRIIEVVVLESDCDGIEQVSEILAERSDLAAVHVITHGTDGQINLGNSWLNSTTLQQNIDAVAGWGNALTETGDILIYGCNLAESEVGQNLISSLSELTLTDVAASDDLTGHHSLGGDWNLELNVGAVETSVALSAQGQEQWSALLAAPADDAFSYPTGDLAGNTGGIGWSGAWGGAGRIQVVATGLSHPTGGLNTSGGAAELNAPPFHIPVLEGRDLSSNLGAVSETVWASFLLQPDETTDPDFSYMGLTFGTGGIANTNQLFVGYSGTDYKINNWGGGGTNIAVPGAVTGETVFLVVRLDISATGNDTATLYVNPTAGLAAPDVAGSAPKSDLDLGTFSTISIGGGRDGATNASQLDQIRIGSSYLSVAPLNEDPTITSNGGGPTASINVAENTTAVTTVTASDVDGDTPTFSISGGADETLFDIDTDSGLLTFKTAPDFESPADANIDNVYVVEVMANDGNGGTDVQTISVTVTDVAPVSVSVSGDATVAANVAYTLNLSAVGEVTDWTINWGDGTIENIIGNPSSASHTYGSSLTGLTFNISASAHNSDGTYFEADLFNTSWSGNLMYRFDGDSGAFENQFGSGDGLIAPMAVTVGPDGLLYVSNFNGDNILRYNPNTLLVVDTFIATGSGGLNGPTDVVFMADGSLLVSSNDSGEILRYDNTGNSLGTFVTAGTGGLVGPNDLLLGADGLLYVSDYEGDQLLRFNASDGTFVDQLANSGNGLNNPEQMDFGPDGRLYLANGGGGNVLAIDTTTKVVSVFVSSASAPSTPTGLQLGPDGNLYVAGFGTSDVRAYDGSTGASLGTRVSSGSGGLSGPYHMAFLPDQQVTVTANNTALWISTDQDAVPPGADGLPGGWREGEVLQFGGLDLNLGPATDGDFSRVIDFDLFTANSTDPGALHFVSRDLTIGGGANQFDLQIGDILVSFNQDEDILAAYYETGAQTTVHLNDLLAFRPDTPGDYTSGTFYMVLNGVPDPLGAPINSLHAISLVEQDAFVGGTLLEAGSFIFSEQAGADPNTPNHIYHFAPTDAGQAAAAGSSQILIDGNDIDIELGKNIRGLELVEKSTTIGGLTLDAGDILVTLMVDDASVGNAPGLSTSTSDIFVLKVTQSEPQAGITAATAEMVMDGSDVNLSGSERVYAIALVPDNYGPAIGGDDTGTVTEDVSVVAGNISDAGTLTIIDPNPGESLLVAETVTGTYGSLTIDAAGNWTYTAGNSQAAIQNLDAGESLSDVLMVTTVDGTTQRITITINGTDDAPVIGGTFTGSVTEDGTLTANGTLTITDVDTSDNPISFPDEGSTLGDNGYGDFVLTAGTWTYTLNNAHAAVQGLDAGETLTDTHTFTASDGSTRVVTITINGADDAPTDLQATSTASGGLSLNADGGNDVYLIADDGGGLLGGLTNVTIEVSFSISTPAGDVTPLFSYADGTNDEELGLFIKNDGSIWFTVHSPGIPYQSTSIQYNQLFDGERHHVGVSWDASIGAVVFFVDGQQVESFSGYRTGQTITGTGQLVFGQDQDSVLGGFSTNDVFSGSIYDVRVFNDVRTAPEIAANYSGILPYDESGLVANWIFNNLSPNGVIIDTVSGNNLTVQHTADPGFIPSTAALTLQVEENAADGTIVGTVAGTDTEREAEIAALLAADSDLVYSAETDKFYKPISAPIDWDVASTAALGTSLNGVNGQLATIRSAAEQEIVAGIAASAGNELWLGGTDETVEGEWRWIQDGSETDQFWQGDSSGNNVNGAYTNWLSGRPDNAGGNQHYLYIRTDGQWNDENISYSTDGYLVEWNADEVLDATDPLTYTIQSQTVAGAFGIDADSGEIAVADGSLLDYETNTSHNITVEVTDAAGDSYSELFTIYVNDVSTTITAGQTFAVSETATNGSAVGSVTTTGDAPTGFNISAGNTGNAFAIDASGNITVNDASAIDFEALNSYTLTVQTTDGTTPVTETVTVNVTDVATTITAGQTFGVSETATNGSAVGSVATTGDAPTGFNISAGNTGNAFAIDASGNITVNDATAIDYEGATSFTLTVEVDDGTSTTSESVTVNVTDVATTITAGQTFAVSETATNGSAVGTVATTGDTPTGFNITAGNTGNAFAIDASGNITVNDASAIDFEVLNSYTLTVQTTDGTTAVTETVTVNVTDVATTITAGQTFGVSETATNGSAVGSVATTGDAPTGFNISAGNTGNAFAIDASGNITVNDATAIDYENATNFTLIVEVDDGTTTTSETVTVNVTDVPATITAGQTFGVSETDGNGTAVSSVATTGDAPTGFNITAGNTGNAFAIDASGNITVNDATAIDYENATSFVLTVEVDDGTSTTSETVTVNVTDVATTITAGQTFAVSETATNGSAVGSVATTGDAPTGFNISAGNTGNAFAIDASGNITVNDATAIDYEGATSFTLTVEADDGTSTTSETVTVNVTDVATTITAGQTFAVSETATNGSAVGTVATTGDTPTGFNITAGNTGNAFAIDASGNITVNDATAIDYEGATSFTLTVEVDDGTTTTSETVTVNVTDVPATITAGQTFGVSETDGNGTAVGSVATTGDTPTGFNITAGNTGNAFAIDASGNITVNDASAIDYEGATSFTLTVEVDDGTTTTSETVTVNVTDINENPVGAIADTDATADSVAENTTVGNAVGITAFADDPDGSDTVTYSLSDDAGGLFSIDSASGVVTIAGSLDYESATSHSITVLATSSDGSTSSNAFTITVTNVNEAPSAADDSVSGNEDTVIVGNVLSNDNDVDGDSLSATLVSGPANGSLTLNTDGTFSYTPAADWNGTDSFTYTATDGALNSNVNTVTITVTPFDDSDPDDGGTGTGTDPDPTSDDPPPDEDGDPIDEAPPDDDPAEDEPVPPIDEYLTPEDAGDPLVRMNVSETEEIIYLTDEVDTDNQSEGRENDRTYASFDHDLYKEINSAKYLDIKGFENTEKTNNLTEVSFIDFAKDDLEQVVVNEEYDLLREEIDEAFQSEQQSKAMKVKIITATMTAFTVGFVSYLLRAGSLISSLLSTLPIWRGFDPIAIFVGDRKKKKNQNDSSDTDESKPDTLFDGEAE